jgi:hypothetical protein
LDVDILKVSKLDFNILMVGKMGVDKNGTTLVANTLRLLTARRDDGLLENLEADLSAQEVGHVALLPALVHLGPIL